MKFVDRIEETARLKDTLSREKSSIELNLLLRETGVLFQGSALFDSMTVLENVMFLLDMFSKETAHEREKRARFCLERVNLSESRRCTFVSYYRGDVVEIGIGLDVYYRNNDMSLSAFVRAAARL